MDSPYRTAPASEPASAPRDAGIADEIIAQFGDPLAFYRELKDRFKAPGEFAQAYVVAHEVGHHVQNLLGIADKVHQARQRAGRAEGNALSVRMELQADCLAGVWGKRTDTMKQVLEPGDLEAALTAASAIGDDRLQQQAQGRIVPESFTHGSSAQRVSATRPKQPIHALTPSLPTARKLALVWGVSADLEPEEPRSFDDILDAVSRHEAASAFKRFVITAGYPYASDNSTDTIKVVERK